MTQDIDLALRVSGDIGDALAVLRKTRAELDATGDAAQGLGGRTTRAGAAAGQASTASRALGERMRHLRPQIQNTAWQVGDFAVQVGAGTSASQAMAQQLPQLLGGFGVLGAVLGAVAAIAVPLGAAFLRTGEEAESASDATSRLADATERLRGLKDLGGDLEDLAERYGVVTARVRDLLAAQRQLAEREARDALRATGKGLLDSLPEALAAGQDRVAADFEDILQGTVHRSGDVLREAGLDVFDVSDNDSVKAHLRDTFGETPTGFVKDADLDNIEDVDTLLNTIIIRLRLFNEGAVRTSFAVMEASESMSAALRRYADELGLAGEQLAGEQTEALSSASLDLRNALDGDDINEVSDAVANMRKVLENALGGEDLTTDQRKALDVLIDRLIAAEDQARRLGTLKTGDLGLGVAIKAAKALADEAARARDELAALPGVQAAALAVARIREATVGDPEARARQLAERGALALQAAATAGRSDLDPAQRFDAEAIRAAGDNAVALARINARTREAEAGLRKSISGSGGGGGKNDPATALIKTLEQYRSRAEIASIRLQGLGGGEEAGFIATAEAARLAETAIAKIGDNPAAAAQVRELEAAVNAAAEEAIAIERALSRGPQGVDAIRAGLRGYAEEASFAGNEIESAVGGAFNGLEDALVQFVSTGKLEVGDLVDSIIADFARIAIRQNITGPLADALAGVLGGGFGGGFGGGTAPAPTTAVRPRGRPFHTGGVAGGVAGDVASRAQAIIAASAATAGRTAREVPAILLEGEAVLTADQSAALSEMLRRRDRPRYHRGGAAGIDPARIPAVYKTQAPGAADMEAGPDVRPANVTVNVENKGAPRTATATARSDGLRGLIVAIVAEDVQSGGAIAQQVTQTLRRQSSGGDGF